VIWAASPALVTAFANDRTNVLAAKTAAEAANDAAPYMHPRRSAIDAPVKLPLKADVGDQGRAVIAAVAEGAITPHASRDADAGRGSAVSHTRNRRASKEGRCLGGLRSG
jgi:hypothetical protein